MMRDTKSSSCDCFSYDECFKCITIANPSHISLLSNKIKISYLHIIEVLAINPDQEGFLMIDAFAKTANLIKCWQNYNSNITVGATAGCELLLTKYANQL